MSKLDAAIGMAMFAPDEMARKQGTQTLVDFAGAVSTGFEVIRGGDGTIGLLYDAEWFDSEIAPLLLDE